MPRCHAASPAAKTTTALVLQGGGALGAYQGGAYAALAARQPALDWVAGISIGAINAALIAGNPPPLRLARLRAFWEQVSLAFLPTPAWGAWLGPWRESWDSAMALLGATQGVPGFFKPRPPWAWWPQTPVSVYDTAPLRASLLELVDFELLNHGPVRLSVGAVDVQSGNFTYFDNRQERIGPEHIMASGALPPGFGAVAVGERWYWDGGLVSNTPLAHVMRHLKGDAEQAVQVFQIDLFSARGALPHTLQAVAERQKDIQYSSRTRMVSDHVRERYEMHQRLRALAQHLTPEQRSNPAVQALLADTNDPSITLVHVIHRRKPYESQNKDYEFSRLSMQEHWSAGQVDMDAALDGLARQGPAAPGEFRVLDHQRPPAQGPRLPPQSTAP